MTPTLDRAQVIQQLTEAVSNLFAKNAPNGTEAFEVVDVVMAVLPPAAPPSSAWSEDLRRELSDWRGYASFIQAHGFRVPQPAGIPADAPAQDVE